ncbi:Nif3-like dinuclear metal center hexameric protein [Halodesulfurarchaeum formicicum]|uniref:Dinuclear metal center protein, YbgI/SA1388 family n=1 Tax=Halodesulfurarchaeum formicicum TaxID=1873524 RepID=A0A1J1A9R6_9EURY|nr:Nif3-like dinuclear metal center hexameric protein [Halodesulfurarchaeum formicicum]APE94868.1 dinuclear metal center protein, YbgI/SA1388 family [Halodesulfurarchaeum formicicum]
MEASVLYDRLDEELAVEDYADVDASANGLQVGSGAGAVDRVAVAVDGVQATFEAAADWDADAMVVHHGLSWGGIDRITGRTYDRVAALVENDIDLYAVHLPLDGHPQYGNAAGLADRLNLGNRAPFGRLGPVTVGQQGWLQQPASPAALHETLEDLLDHGGQGVRLLDFGPEEIESVAILTGSGTDWLDEAVAADVDAYVTGEPEGKLYHMAREAGVNVFLGGHYGTETFGVRALADLIAEWGPETAFLDEPTGL